MREPNSSVPSQNKASLTITSGIYDRRALDCTATIPLINSLTHLAYLTSTTPRIRDIVCIDGGLERLAQILSETPSKIDQLTVWKRTLAFQAIVNIGIRGTEQIRTRVAHADVIPFAIDLLYHFMLSFESKNQALEKKKVSTSIMPNNDEMQSSNKNHFNENLINDTINATSTNNNNNNNKLSTARRSTFPYIKIDRTQRFHSRLVRQKQYMSKSSNLDGEHNTIFREEDVLSCLQLLAYLSKYAHIRELFHTAFKSNVFCVVENFCFRQYSSTIQYWAGVVMRNACRKDETKGGVRRCANKSCGQWESQPREFAKCRRCRKAKYCSKDCQSKAWADGHRWWCLERPSASRPCNQSTNTNNNPSSNQVGSSSTTSNSTSQIDTNDSGNIINTESNTSNFSNNNNNMTVIDENNNEASSDQSIMIGISIRMDL